MTEVKALPEHDIHQKADGIVRLFRERQQIDALPAVTAPLEEQAVDLAQRHGEAAGLNGRRMLFAGCGCCAEGR